MAQSDPSAPHGDQQPSYPPADQPHVYEPYWRKGRSVAAIVATVAVIALVKFFGASALHGLFGGSSTDTASVERALNDSPMGEPIRVMRERFPDDYVRFLSLVTQAAASNDPASAARQGFEFARTLMRSHMDGLSKAPTAELTEIAGQYRLIVRELRDADRAMCASFVTTGIQPGRHPPAQVAVLMQHAVALQLRAASDGERNPVARTAMTDADTQAFGEAVERLRPGSVAMLSDPSGFANAPQQVQCDVGVAVYEAAAALPAEQSARVTVSMLQESLGAN